MKKYFFLLVTFVALLSSCLGDNSDPIDPTVYYTSHLENSDSLKVNNFWNGSTANGEYYYDSFIVYTNNYNQEWGSWDGFSISKSTETTVSYENYMTDQFNSCCINPYSPTFAIGYYSAYANQAPTIYIVESATDKTHRKFYPTEILVTNAAYAVASMKNGDDYAKKFTEEDYLYLYITGYLNGTQTNQLKCPLAEKGEILEKWAIADLRGMGLVDEIRFTMDSSDKGDYGINTPTYFCIDNFTFSFTQAQ